MLTGCAARGSVFLKGTSNSRPARSQAFSIATRFWRSGRAKRHGRWLGVAVIDLDGFKPINDEYGHEMGDAVLAEVGRVLRASVRTEDFVGRIGGDEFVLIFPEASANALHVAVRRAFALIREQLEVVGTSYGVHSQMLGKSSPETFDDFKKAADAKMYEDKRAKKAQR
ncbi:MAG: GGDEF domain-containing protein [Patescibacteria group bacterium]|nr:GGDEF domain-containing protein [Patescibacteria group bacterium]